MLKKVAAIITTAVVATSALGYQTVPARASSSSQAPNAACTRSAYTFTCGTTIPKAGKFTISIPNMSVKIVGTGSKSTAGTKLRIAQVPTPKKSLGGVGIRLSATGKFNPLHLSSGTLYKYNQASNKVSKTKNIIASGIYQIVS